MIALDTILLFTLTMPFIMGYRISPFPTEHWLFGIVFLCLLLYGTLDVFFRRYPRYSPLKNSLLVLLLCIIIGGSFTDTISKRHISHPTYKVHDIILQQEAALQFLVAGKNPYKMTYFGTFLENWYYSDKEVNPALYHFVMEPFYLLFALPFYFTGFRVLGFFDARFPLLFLFGILLVTAYLIPGKMEKKREFVILLALHPAMLAYTLEGRSDIFMYSFLLAGLLLLLRRRYNAAGIPLALAFAVKQSAWPLFPFYTAFLYYKTKNIRKTLRYLSFFFIPFAALLIPFLLWDMQAFTDSTLGFLNGSVPHSYPVSGYGIGAVLSESGIIRDKFAYYPFYLWQIAFGFPVLVMLLRFLKKQAAVKTVILCYGLFLFIFWYFSRYFNNSHLAYLSVVFISAYYFPSDLRT